MRGVGGEACDGGRFACVTEGRVAAPPGGRRAAAEPPSGPSRARRMRDALPAPRYASTVADSRMRKHRRGRGGEIAVATDGRAVGQSNVCARHAESWGAVCTARCRRAGEAQNDARRLSRRQTFDAIRGLLECIHKVPSLSYARTARTEVGAHSRSGAPRDEICRSGVTVVATPQSTPAGASARGELGLADGEPPIVRRMPGVGRGRPAPGGEVTAGGERVDDGRSASVRMPDALLALSAVTSIAPKGLRLRAGARPGLATVGRGCLSVRNGTCKRVSEARNSGRSVELQ